MADPHVVILDVSRNDSISCYECHYAVRAAKCRDVYTVKYARVPYDNGNCAPEVPIATVGLAANISFPTIMLLPHNPRRQSDDIGSSRWFQSLLEFLFPAKTVGLVLVKNLHTNINTTAMIIRHTPTDRVMEGSASTKFICLLRKRFREREIAQHGVGSVVTLLVDKMSSAIVEQSPTVEDRDPESEQETPKVSCYGTIPLMVIHNPRLGDSDIYFAADVRKERLTITRSEYNPGPENTECLGYGVFHSWDGENTHLSLETVSLDTYTHALINRLFIQFPDLCEVRHTVTGTEEAHPTRSYILTTRPSPTDSKESVDVTVCPFTGYELSLAATGFCTD